MSSKEAKRIAIGYWAPGDSQVEVEYLDPVTMKTVAREKQSRKVFFQIKTPDNGQPVLPADKQVRP